jgi:hypothetical protein
MVCLQCWLTLDNWDTREGIIKWVVKKAGPAAATADTTEALAALEESEEVIILGYFKALEVGFARLLVTCGATAASEALLTVVAAQGDDYSAFLKAAQSSDEVTFVQTTSKDVAKAAGLTAYGVAAITNFPSKPPALSKESGHTCFAIRVMAAVGTFLSGAHRSCTMHDVPS